MSIAIANVTTTTATQTKKRQRCIWMILLPSFQTIETKTEKTKENIFSVMRKLKQNKRKLKFEWKFIKKKKEYKKKVGKLKKFIEMNFVKIIATWLDKNA